MSFNASICHGCERVLRLSRRSCSIVMGTSGRTNIFPMWRQLRTLGISIFLQEMLTSALKNDCADCEDHDAYQCEPKLMRDAGYAPLFGVEQDAPCIMNKKGQRLEAHEDVEDGDRRELEWMTEKIQKCLGYTSLRAGLVHDRKLLRSEEHTSELQSHVNLV